MKRSRMRKPSSWKRAIWAGLSSIMGKARMPNQGGTLPERGAQAQGGAGGGGRGGGMVGGAHLDRGKGANAEPGAPLPRGGGACLGRGGGRRAQCGNAVGQPI